MFYCDECAKKKGWRTSLFQSLGNCEVCGKVASCSEIPSSQLPSTPKNKDDKK